ncbi:ABC transporter substrate-binding protein [Paenibacillus sedimenti]|uniref:Extracellular solute-binding protein n=1 Tax=Paenibacillus sedimenti TaxID=2770274 RepID=A0A926KVE9_9BACL|nr:extracellular solute-binding protein [Paenibacillus sedimenti]MBD0383601.1 extracellular solute-binding protein [Paenibacillus sedimenti]
MKQRPSWFKSLSVTMIAAAVGLTGCSSGKQAEQAVVTPQASSSAATTAPASGKAAKLKIMWWGTQARHDATLKALELYTQQVPNVTFTPEYTAWDGFWEKLPTLAASNSIPDVLQMDAAYIQSYVKRGQLADLSDMDLNGIVDPKILENVKINGKLYGVPLSLNGQGMVYNKPELEAAGIKLPFNNWTYDDFFAFAKEARAKLPKDKYPIDDLTNIWDWYQYYQTAQGKGPIFQDGTKFNLDKDTWFQFQNIYAQFRKDGVVPSAEMQLSFKENDPKLDSLAAGKVMMRGASVGSVGAVESLLPGKLVVNSNPIGPKGGGWAQSTIFLSVGANSSNKDQAKQFIKWFVSNQEAGKVLGTTRGIPINETIFKSIEPTLSKGDLFGKQMLNAAKEKALPFYPAPPGSEDFVKTYKTEMEAVMFGKQTLEQAYTTITEKGKDAEAKLNKK